MNRTTELLKEIKDWEEDKFSPTDVVSFYKFKSKAELNGRLDVLKGELDFLRGLGLLRSDNRYCEECHFICHIINKKIQEITNEIKQIEGEK